uniref:MMS1_N domain-containing protein n=1 Tax=Toxocara canis TaxID=6265 RepID=A0A183VF65_TOXCA
LEAERKKQFNYHFRKRNMEVNGSNMQDAGVQAILCVTPVDTIALVLSHEVIVEITLNKHVRLSHGGALAATICRGGSVAAVHHPSLHIVQQKTQVQFDLAEGVLVSAASNALHVFGLASQDSTTRVHTVTKNEVLKHDDLSVATDRFADGWCSWDTTRALLLEEVAGGEVVGIQEDKRARCLLVARRAIIDLNNSLLSAIVEGVKIKHDVCSGDTRVYCGRNFISLCVATHALTLHSPWVEINVDRSARTRLVRGDQIIETTHRRLHLMQNTMQAHFFLPSVAGQDEPSCDNLDHVRKPLFALSS